MTDCFRANIFTSQWLVIYCISARLLGKPKLQKQTRELSPKHFWTGGGGDPRELKRNLRRPIAYIMAGVNMTLTHWHDMDSVNGIVGKVSAL